MNETTRERSAGFTALQDALTLVSKDIADYVKEQTK
jgi:N-formylglutamate deformylase